MRNLVILVIGILLVSCNTKKESFENNYLLIKKDLTYQIVKKIDDKHTAVMIAKLGKETIFNSHKGKVIGKDLIFLIELLKERNANDIARELPCTCGRDENGNLIWSQICDGGCILKETYKATVIDRILGFDCCRTLNKIIFNRKNYTSMQRIP